MNSVSIFRKNDKSTKEFIPRQNTDLKDTGRIYSINVERIVPNPSQPRKNFEDEAIIRLADSIRRYGILQPLTVRRLDADGCGYELVAGERRLRAARLLGLYEIPCIIIDVDEQKSAELAIIENIQRENLNIFEQAGAIASLIDIYNLTQEQIAKQLSTSQSYVANKLRILRLTASERELILKYSLTERHARALLKVDDVKTRTSIIEYIAAKGLNVSASEDYIERRLCEKIMSVDAAAGNKSKRKLILKDIRIFYNTIEKALDTVKNAGIPIASNRRESEGCVEIIITIPKQYEASKSA